MVGTEQESFWQGDFGDEYIERNRYQAEQLLVSNTALFSKILSRAGKVKSVIEFGANVGQNIMALSRLIPDGDFEAVEINAKAASLFEENAPGAILHRSSILDFSTDRAFDMVLIKGVLIHQNPKRLPDIYTLMHKCSSRYVAVVEYYNPVPVEVDYRGHSERLYKRDFAGEMLDMFPDLSLADYGFAYHRDNNFPIGDMTWFLLEKR